MSNYRNKYQVHPGLRHVIRKKFKQDYNEVIRRKLESTFPNYMFPRLHNVEKIIESQCM